MSVVVFFHRRARSITTRRAHQSILYLVTLRLSTKVPKDRFIWWGRLCLLSWPINLNYLIFCCLSFLVYEGVQSFKMTNDIICAKCGMVFVAKRELNDHMNQVHKQHLFQCQSCNKVLDNEKQFRVHMVIHTQYIEKHTY